MQHYTSNSRTFQDVFAIYPSPTHIEYKRGKVDASHMMADAGGALLALRIGWSHAALRLRWLLLCFDGVGSAAVPTRFRRAYASAGVFR